MIKKKKPENVQARNVKLLLYPDNMVHNNALGLIASHMIDDSEGASLPYTFLSCLHDRSEGKPHYHVCVSVAEDRGGVYLGAFARSLGLVDDLGQPDLQFVRKCDGRLDSADVVVRIDYGRDFPSALSAASASAILAFEVFRQNR